MTEKHKSIEWTFWLVWVLASAFGGITSTVLAVKVYGMLPSPWGSVGFYSMFGSGVGAMQWLMLRRWMPFTSRWALASVIAGVCAGIIAAIWGNAADLVLGYGGFGALLGSLQWLVLREYTPRAGWWLLASPVGWAIAVAAVRWIDTIVALPEIAGVVLAFGTIAAVAAIVTGIAFVWLIQEPILEPASSG
jgi:hypothetical protein